MPWIQVIASIVALALPTFDGSQGSGPAAVGVHDNLRTAGRMANGELRLSLWAGRGRWRPDGERSAGVDVAAFGEEGGPLSVPAPLIRASAGTVVHVTLRNTLTSALHVRGLCDRPAPCTPLVVPAAATREVRFTLTAPGTFHYWASTAEGPLDARFGADSQMGGAIVADAPGVSVSDRVFVMTLWRESLDLSAPDLTAINGRSWPHTERLRYATGDTAHWRIVNLTSAPHAMHLHGFYFTVDSIGDGQRDTIFPPADRRQAVTEQMPPGRAMTMTWVPERPGNWLFHCHMLVHMMSHDDLHAATSTGQAFDATSAGMAGLVLGVQVTGPDRTTRAADETPRRSLRMIVEPDSRRATASYRVRLEEPGRAFPRVSEQAVPGPILVLTRGQPVAVEIVNRLSEPTAIHWHGIELESYDDGVPGFGQSGASVTPPVAPGGTFTARFTPPRAGTFIYHTHWHNAGQLAGGIYGPLVVFEPGETWNPAIDHLVVIGLDGAYTDIPNEPFVVNGAAPPSPLVLAAGVAHRLRAINITADNVALTLQLVSRFDPVRWTIVGKDGAAIPNALRREEPARQLVSVGETYDFQLGPLPPTPVGLWLELRRGNGEMVFQWPVQVR
jgi:FtsP/CotA-like multicopper oxidase with cupredoxin domain